VSLALEEGKGLLDRARSCGVGAAELEHRGEIEVASA
jgi:hypothetical protein